jgi:hypothetical protein
MRAAGDPPSDNNSKDSNGESRSAVHSWQAPSVQELIISFQLPCLESVCAVGSFVKFCVGLSVVTRVERLASFQELIVFGRLTTVSSFKELLSKFGCLPLS